LIGVVVVVRAKIWMSVMSGLPFLQPVFGFLFLLAIVLSGAGFLHGHPTHFGSSFYQLNFRKDD